MSLNNKEKWISINGFDGFYSISNKGRIKSLDRTITDKIGRKYIVKGRIMRPCISFKQEYPMISFYKNNKGETHYIHRLMGQYFIPNPNNYSQINHKNGNKKDFRLCNLEWVTRSENNNHAYSSGLKRSGQNHPFSKLTNKKVLLIRRLKPNMSYSKICKKFDICIGTAQRIVKRKAWKHI